MPLEALGIYPSLHHTLRYESVFVFLMHVLYVHSLLLISMVSHPNVTIITLMYALMILLLHTSYLIIIRYFVTYHFAL